MTDYNETWLQAMDILISKRLSEISFDRTISATIEDASRADEGIYLVSTGNAKFTAYSRDSSYRVNDTVMVTIPEGDYDKQKMIIGKQVKNQNDTPISYRSPFQNFINISNNLIKGFSSNFGMYANGQDDAYKWSEEISDFLQSEAWADYQNNKSSLYSTNDSKLWQGDTIKVIWDSGELREPIIGYSMLGIQAQFSTWLADYDTAAGNYGVAAVLELRNPDNPSAEPYYTTAIFDSDEFFGDVYNFESFYTQEKVFDISKVAENANITHITLLVYQRGNFVQADGAPVPTPADNDFSDIGPNIWIKDPSIDFGMSIDDFKGDSATLLCSDRNNYGKDIHNYVQINEFKNIYTDKLNEIANCYINAMDQGATQNCRLLNYSDTDINSNNINDFISFFFETINSNSETRYETIINFNNSTTDIKDDKKEKFLELLFEAQKYAKLLRQECILDIKKIIDLRWVHKDDKTELISTMESVPEGYEIRWYRYEFGASSPDDFAGAFWTRISDNKNTKLNSFFQLLLTPDINRQEERIKVIIVKKENNLDKKIAVSNEIIFTNNEKIPDLSTLEQVDGLAIRFDDPQRGRYFLYNRSGQIKNKGAAEDRTLTAVFSTTDKNVYTKRDLIIDSGETLTWYFPKDNSMIELSESNPDIEEKYYVVSQHSGDAPVVHYKIKDYLATNYLDNTVIAQIKKNNITYTATATMVFGLQGTSGSEYTIDFIWGTKTNNTLGLNVEPTGDQIKKDNNSILECSFVLRDQDSIPVSLPKNAEFETSWLINQSFKNFSSIEDFSPHSIIENNRNLLYPILDDPNLRLTSEIMGEDCAEQYYITSNQADDNKYHYNLNTNQFEKNDENVNYTRQYAKLKDKDNNDNELFKNKFVYQSISYKQIQDKVMGSNSINLEDLIFKLFIKINNSYILYPYAEIDVENLQNMQFYYPVEYKEYQGTELLKIQEVTGDSNENIQILKANENYEKAFCFEGISILQVTLTNFGDYKLVAYFPIPFYANDNNNTLRAAIVPNYVYYLSSGEVDYLKNPFQLVFNNNESSIFNGGSQIYPAENQKGWRLFIYKPENGTSLHFNEESSLLDTFHGFNNPELKETNDGIILNPPSIYFENNGFYAIQYVSNNTVYYSSPVVTIQNRYPSSTINAWNGKDLIIDEDHGTILSSAIAAGKKEKNNTFTGVVIGDWSRTDADTSLTKQTGVYGFKEGAMTYALKDDGTAFLGKDGRGRLLFDGNKSQIYSSNWQAASSGMFLDIDDGVLKLQQKYKANAAGSDVVGNYHEIPLSSQQDFEDKKNILYYKEDYRHVIAEDLNNTDSYNETFSLTLSTADIGDNITIYPNINYTIQAQIKNFTIKDISYSYQPQLNVQYYKENDNIENAQTKTFLINTNLQQNNSFEFLINFNDFSLTNDKYIFNYFLSLQKTKNGLTKDIPISDCSLFFNNIKYQSSSDGAILTNIPLSKKTYNQSNNIIDFYHPDFDNNYLELNFCPTQDYGDSIYENPLNENPISYLLKIVKNNSIINKPIAQIDSTCYLRIPLTWYKNQWFLYFKQLFNGKYDGSGLITNFSDLGISDNDSNKFIEAYKKGFNVEYGVSEQGSDFYASGSHAWNPSSLYIYKDENISAENIWRASTSEFYFYCPLSINEDTITSDSQINNYEDYSIVQIYLKGNFYNKIKVGYLKKNVKIRSLETGNFIYDNVFYIPIDPDDLSLFSDVNCLSQIENIISVLDYIKYDSILALTIVNAIHFFNILHPIDFKNFLDNIQKSYYLETYDHKYGAPGQNLTYEQTSYIYTVDYYDNNNNHIFIKSNTRKEENEININQNLIYLFNTSNNISFESLIYELLFVKKLDDTMASIQIENSNIFFPYKINNHYLTNPYFKDDLEFYTEIAAIEDGWDQRGTFYITSPGNITYQNSQNMSITGTNIINNNEKLYYNTLFESLINKGYPKITYEDQLPSIKSIEFLDNIFNINSVPNWAIYKIWVEDYNPLISENISMSIESNITFILYYNYYYSPLKAFYTNTSTDDSAISEQSTLEEQQSFITLDSRKNKIYPLAIGTSEKPEERDFRVAWDGSTIIQNGTIYANAGSIGGWQINQNSIESNNGLTILNASKGIIESQYFVVPHFGRIGYSIGKALNNDKEVVDTDVFGMVSDNYSIVLEALRSSIRLSAAQIYLQPYNLNGEAGEIRIDLDNIRTIDGTKTLREWINNP